MRTILKFFFAICLLPAAAIAQKTVTAESIIESINNNTAVALNGVEVAGDLDFTRLKNMKEESHQSSEKIYISTVNVPVRFVNCTFSGKVLGYFNPDATIPIAKSHVVYNANFTGDVNFENCSFKKAVSFKYSEFEDKVSFAGSKFNDDVEFKYTKFDEGPKFTSSVFEAASVFKYVEFPEGFDFSNSVFESHADFKYAKFMDGGSFANATFKNGGDFKYAGFSRSVSLKGASFKGFNDFKYTTLDNEKTTVEELVSR